MILMMLPPLHKNAVLLGFAPLWSAISQKSKKKTKKNEKYFFKTQDPHFLRDSRLNPIFCGRASACPRDYHSLTKIAIVKCISYFQQVGPGGMMQMQQRMGGPGMPGMPE